MKCQWEPLKQTLKTPRRFFVAMFVPDSVVECKEKASLDFQSESPPSKNDFHKRVATEEYVDGVQDEVSVEEIFHPPAPQYSQVPVLNT